MKSRLTGNTILVGIAATLALGAAQQRAWAQGSNPCADPAACAPRALFAPAELRSPATAAELEAYMVTPDFAALRGGAGPAAANSIELNLPGNGAPIAVLDRARGGSWSGVTARGHNAVIDSDGRHMYAHIFTGREWWVVRPDGNGHRLSKVDNGALRPDGNPIAVKPGIKSATTTNTKQSATTATVAADTTTTIDVLFLYTREAAAAIGDGAALDLFAAHAMSVENAVLVNSEAGGIEFRAVGSAVADRSDGYTVDQDLAWAKDDPAVGALRDEVGADVVVLIADYGGAVSGLAYEQSYPDASFAPYAFAVVDRYSVENGLSLQHELGHLLGMQHDPLDATTNSPPAYAYGYGHVNGPDDTHTLGFLTVMSYQGACGGSPPCYQVPYYSNASITLDSDPVQGRALGVPDQRENYRIALATAPIVAAFRDAKPPLLSDNFE